MFVAVDPDAPARDALRRLAERLACRLGNRAVKWVLPDQLHATVAFLGDVTDERVDAVVDVLRAVASETKPFTVAVAGVGAFPPAGAPRVIWAGVTDGASELAAVSQRLGLSLERRGFPRDHRPYHAHVTLGRCRAAVDVQTWRELCARIAGGLEVCRWTVSSLQLYRSTLTPGGSRYDVVHTCPCST